MKTKLSLVLGLFCVLFMSACSNKQAAVPFQGQVRVLAYSSMGSEGGFLKTVLPRFQDESHCELKIQTTLGAAQILTQLKEHPNDTDFVVGIDSLLFERGGDVWDRESLQGRAATVKWNKKVTAGNPQGFYALDYGALTLIYNRAKLKELKLLPPAKAADLLKPEYKKKFIVQDPRVSSPGMMFFSWLPKTVPLSKMRSQWLALAQSWDSSYQMFMQGEAPMVWSYLSSIAYHASKGKGQEYGFVDFAEGLPLQIEGMAKVKQMNPSPANQACAQKWFDFIYTPLSQSMIVEKQWMLPAMEGVTLPPSFLGISTFVHFSPKQNTVAELDQLLSRFGKEVQGDHW